MESKFQKDVRSKVLTALETQPLTYTELSNNLKINYYSVRNCIQNLRDTGLVRPIYSGSTRNMKWQLGEDANPNGIIPNLVMGNGRHKAHLLMMTYPQTETGAGKAMMRLPMLITQLMRAAKKSYTDDTVMDHSIATVRKQLQEDMVTLEESLNLIKQILDNDKFWNATLLTRFPHDATWNDDLLEKAVAHYFPKE